MRVQSGRSPISVRLVLVPFASVLAEALRDRYDLSRLLQRGPDVRLLSSFAFSRHNRTSSCPFALLSRERRSNYRQGDRLRRAQRYRRSGLTTRRFLDIRAGTGSRFRPVLGVKRDYFEGRIVVVEERGKYRFDEDFEQLFEVVRVAFRTRSIPRGTTSDSADRSG
jgi:hypothetical protein